MRRLAALDGLRGLAALMVFVNHVQLPGIQPIAPGLDAGVLIFFALSGYLLYAPFAAAHHGRRRVDLPTYAIRRLLRIAPAYLVAAFAISWLWYPTLLEDPIGVASTQWGPILVVWTLQLEIAFYILLPVIAAILGRFGPAGRIRVLLAAGTASIAATAIVMILFSRVIGAIPGQALSTFASYLWAFVPGMIVAELEQRGRFARPLPTLVLVPAFAMIAVSSVLNPPAFFDLSASVGAAALIAFVVSRPAAGQRFERVFAVAGALSYSVYLWQEAIFDEVDRPNPTWA